MIVDIFKMIIIILYFLFYRAVNEMKKCADGKKFHACADRGKFFKIVSAILKSVTMCKDDGKGNAFSLIHG